ncbi:MAG: RNA polymerase sigma factor [Nannocystales bacterium]
MNNTERSDAELMEAWRGGDRDAGGLIIERYHRLLFRFFLNKASDAAEDLVQQTLTVCVERRDEVRDAASFRAYLLAVARSELVRHYRCTARRQARFDPLETSVEDLDPRPSTWVVRRQEQQLVQRALRRLPLDYQIALESYYWENATAPEIAHVLGIPEGTVRSRLRRGKEILREQMGAQSPQLRDAALESLEAQTRALGDTLHQISGP